MTIDFKPESFQTSMPEVWRGIFYTLQSYGFVPIVVGGSVRDYFLNGSFGNDWDIEVTHPNQTFDQDKWRELGKNLSKLGKVSHLPYEILRLSTHDIHFEFSPPRIEIFDDQWNISGHSNFKAELNFQIPFELSVKRRDFSVNAIGIRFNSFKELELIDPLNGLGHLHEKLLHFCGSDFNKDPVRFLRAIRFSLKFDFKFSPDLENVLLEMPVSGLTSAYFWNELLKSDTPFMMLKKLIEWKMRKPDLNIPLLIEDFRPKEDQIKSVLIDPTKHESWIIALEWVGIGCESWQNFFSLSTISTSRLARWTQLSKKMLNISPDIFHRNFSDVCDLQEFDVLFDWFFSTKQLLQKYPNLSFLKLIEDFLPDWVGLFRIELLKDVKHIEPPLRAKYQVWNLCQK
jgi:hypothetical protein